MKRTYSTVFERWWELSEWPEGIVNDIITRDSVKHLAWKAWKMGRRKLKQQQCKQEATT